MDTLISLLPYIESDREGFVLDLPVPERGPESSPGDSSPFQIADSGGNFSILVKAGIKTGPSQIVTPFFLLTQRDHYPIPPDDLHPLTNADMDRIWIETLRFYTGDEIAFTLPGPPGREKEPLAFHSLFFCKKKKKFFQPPCPECGEPLVLCKDDQALKGAGLFPYYTSLHRYLYCPRCHGAKADPAFYQFSRSSEDRVFVKDRFDLIRDFNRLRSRASGNFPCLECPGHAECYITGEKAGSRIAFFSFYPFYMLFFHAASIKAVDFLPLISGASPEQIPSLSMTVRGADFTECLGRKGTPRFFFEQDERFFLEVLYLKLSFLESFVRCFSRKGDIPSLPGFSAHSIWIRPGPDKGILPVFWDFSLNVIDLVSDVHLNRDQHVLTQNRDLVFMVRLWFHTFLANSNQGPGAVYDLAGSLAGHQTAGHSFDSQALVREFPGLAPENIFWEPRPQAIPGEWEPFWFKTLFTGLSLLKQEPGRDLKSCLAGLLADMKSLKQEIQTELFSTRPPAPAAPLWEARPMEENNAAEQKKAPEESLPEKEAIAGMLKSLRTRWAQASPAPLADMEEDVLETIVLSSPDEAPEPPEENRQEPAEKPPEPDDFFEETVVLQGPVPPDSDDGAGDDTHDFEEMEETVVLSPGQSPTPAEPDTGFFGEEDDLDKTIIIPPKK
ncbi:hypothetical protein [Desulfospira joergensenii]|uniref:hypothetical protein n=1 Tax=Desulfospira joergensenii TaxID=53329 RepID=UPI000481A38D|nr:hypothetical protein [Desulfospira joergensenii]